MKRQRWSLLLLVTLGFTTLVRAQAAPTATVVAYGDTYINACQASELVSLKARFK